MNEIHSYYAVITSPEGATLFEDEFYQSIPIMNRRAAYRYLHEKQRELLSYIPDSRASIEYTKRCNYEIGYWCNNEKFPIEGKHLDLDFVMRIRKEEYKTYIIKGYNTAGDGVRFFHSLFNETYKILRDNDIYHALQLPV